MTTASRSTKAGMLSPATPVALPVRFGGGPRSTKAGMLSPATLSTPAAKGGYATRTQRRPGC